MSVAQMSRSVACDGAFNLRDLGGYLADDGRTTRWRTLFRADGLHRVADTARLAAELDLRTVLDLRSFAEVEVARFDCPDVEVVHVPVLRETWDAATLQDPSGDACEFLTARYVEMCSQGASAIAYAFHMLQMRQRLPAVFHCFAGKDRTGVLAALVLAALGVNDEQIAEDYALSAPAMGRLMEWIAANRPEVGEQMARQSVPFLSCPSGAIIGLLDHLRDRHGAIHLYLADIGVERAAIEMLRDTLLED